MHRNRSTATTTVCAIFGQGLPFGACSCGSAKLTQYQDVTNNYRSETHGPRTLDERPWRRALLDWLRFAEIDDRRAQVADAHRMTFRWIFREEGTVGFLGWLRFGQGVYWIQGKPASGKSTLMKYITDEPRLQDALQIWTKRTPLVIGSFWFWAAGSRIQRSLAGLYRTLLCQILSAESALCRLAFPDWHPKFFNTDPTIEMLVVAMGRILKADKLSKNFFFIIDGLDEYERNSMGKTKLAELMLDMAQSPRVKILLSSRPESAFASCFHRRVVPTIHLHHLTRPDIAAYVDARLPSVSSLDITERWDEAETRYVADYIVDNAAGVFLWVILIVNIVLDGVHHSDGIRMIRQRIEELPQELDDLFTHILTKRIAQRHKPEAFRYLLIVLEWQSVRDYWPGLSAQRWDGDSVPVVALAVAQQASDRYMASHLARLSPDQIRATAVRLRSHLKSRCQGLLELSRLNLQGPAAGDTERGPSRVYFLHRTLYDYLKQHADVVALFRAGVGGEFEIYEAMMTGWIAYQRCQPLNRALVKSSQAQIPIIFRLNALAEAFTGRPQTELLAVIDYEMTIRAGTVHQRPLGSGRHWTSRFCESSDLLAYTVSTGAWQYLQETIIKGNGIPRKTGRPLLQYAVPPYSQTQGRRVDAINFNAVILLLENGEDPFSDYYGWNTWLNAMSWFTKNEQILNCHSLPQILDVMKLLADHSSYQSRSGTIFLDNYTPTGAIRGLLLQSKCCWGVEVHRCSCSKARELSLHAYETLRCFNPRHRNRSTSIRTSISQHPAPVAPAAAVRFGSLRRTYDESNPRGSRQLYERGRSRHVAREIVPLPNHTPLLYGTRSYGQHHSVPRLERRSDASFRTESVGHHSEPHQRHPVRYATASQERSSESHAMHWDKQHTTDTHVRDASHHQHLQIGTYMYRTNDQRTGRQPQHDRALENSHKGTRPHSAHNEQTHASTSAYPGAQNPSANGSHEIPGSNRRVAQPHSERSLPRVKRKRRRSLWSRFKRWFWGTSRA